MGRIRMVWAYIPMVFEPLSETSHPIGSMYGMEYLPTFKAQIYGFNVGEYSTHGAFGGYTYNQSKQACLEMQTSPSPASSPFQAWIWKVG